MASGSWNRSLLCRHRAPRVAIIFLGCMCLTGCPRIGREFLVGGSFNQVYFDCCEAMRAKDGIDDRRLINAYTSLLYLDAEVASVAVRGIAKVDPRVGVNPYPGTDEAVAFRALQRLIPLYRSQQDCLGLLDVLRQHKSLILYADNYELLDKIAAVLEDARDRGGDMADIREVAAVLVCQAERVTSGSLESRQNLIERVGRLTS